VQSNGKAARLLELDYQFESPWFVLTISLRNPNTVEAINRQLLVKHDASRLLCVPKT
jgi:hypothetical protein